MLKDASHGPGQPLPHTFTRRLKLVEAHIWTPVPHGSAVGVGRYSPVNQVLALTGGNLYKRVMLGNALLGKWKYTFRELAGAGRYETGCDAREICGMDGNFHVASCDKTAGGRSWISPVVDSTSSLMGGRAQFIITLAAEIALSRCHELEPVGYHAGERQYARKLRVRGQWYPGAVFTHTDNVSGGSSAASEGERCSPS
jgi:hypothetical protein